MILLIPFLFISSCKKNQQPEKKEIHVTNIIIEPLNDLSIGETETLKITKVPENAIDEITISTNANDLINIENNNITALKDGKVTITVTSSNNISNSINFNISSILVNDGVVTGVKNKNIDYLYIPHIFKNQKITKIGQDALANLSNLKKVDIEEGIEEIEKYAFSNNTNLEEISLPSTLKKVHNSSFEYCEKIKYNEKENGLYLGNESNNYLVLVKAKQLDIETINVENETRIILDYAFENCTNLKNIKMNDDIIHIGEYAFFECS